jgi:electron transport complex protein RnfB
MDSAEQVYRDLQRHLDKQPIGFPASKSGAEIRILKRLFTVEQAKLALHLDYKLSTAQQVHERAKGTGLSPGEVRTMLGDMAESGSIGRVEKDGIQYFHTIPFVVGMYETQAGRLSPEFLAEADAYFKERSFGLSFMSTSVPQMRTIPVEKSLAVEHAVTTYDALTGVLRDSPGPFGIGPCICREAAELRGKQCRTTSRLETCMAIGDMARPVLGRNGWREVNRDEALEIARLNQADGLVLQPSNTQKLDFICACCSCCCGMLSSLRSLPKPVEFWATNYHARVDPELCSGCATCVDRCPMGAATLADGAQAARVDLDRCIGCGLCVTTCPSGASSLIKKSREVVPPLDLQDQYETIMTHKKGALGKMRVAAKIVLKV